MMPSGVGDDGVVVYGVYADREIGEAVAAVVVTVEGIGVVLFEAPISMCPSSLQRRSSHELWNGVQTSH